MALTKQAVPIDFSQGLDTKTDPYQVAVGHFLLMSNSVFTTAKRLTKRNGFGSLTMLPDTTSNTLTTYNGNLVAVGNNLNVLSEDTNNWFTKGPIQQLDLKVTPVVRTNTSQLTVDSAIATNNLTCTVWYDSNTTSYYRITDGETGGVIVNTTALPATASATVGPKVAVVGNYFVIFYWKLVTAVPTLFYLAIPTNTPSTPVNPGGTSTSLTGPAITSPFDCFSSSSTLYFGCLATASTISISYLSAVLAQAPITSTTTTSGNVPNSISITTDPNVTVVWLTWYDSINGVIQTRGFNSTLIPIVPITNLATGGVGYVNSSFQNNVLTCFYSSANTYTYTPNSPHTAGNASYFTSTVTGTYSPTANTITPGTGSVVARSVAITSKAFYIPTTNKTYSIVAYAGLMQPTYFVIDSVGNVVAKLAYSNGAGYTAGSNLSQVDVVNNVAYSGYLFKDLTTPVNKTTQPSGTQPGQIPGIYNQTGINVVKLNFSPGGMPTTELGGSLNLAGGFLWQYDGTYPVEQNFHLYPEDVQAINAASGGSITAGTYFYQATYEWTDAQGIIHRSSPSVPVTTGAISGSTNLITVRVPTLRLTYKITPNPVRIVIYRWSVAQQTYYQITSVTSPITNDPNADHITYVDNALDSAIVGNTILYTNGGVVENISAPSISAMTPFKSRLFGVDAEDRNLLWFSKQVIEQTPVEMSDLLTLYVAPTISAQGDTGPITALSAMDDKLIIFKEDAIYYITGVGPDNTGANNDFSDPIFITSSVGCNNQDSIIIMTNGIMFQSNKGIWLLDRQLGTNYIGAAVESFNSIAVTAALNIPGTNQVRFKLANGVTLMYDYFFNQWGTFTGCGGITATLYLGLETYADQYGRVFQETPGLYQDGSNPVLMSLTTSWLNIAGLQGYERAYYFFLLGNFLSPHKLNINVAFDYNPTPVQTTLITPTNYSGTFGSPYVYGSDPFFGGQSNLESWKIHFNTQRCQAFQVSIQEVFDPSYGTTPGAGLTLSGLNMIVGVKKGWRNQAAKHQAG